MEQPQAERGRVAGFSLDLSPRTVLRWLCAAVVVLVVASVAGQVLLRELPGLPLVGGLAHALYVDSEQSLPTIFAVLLLLSAAGLLAVVAALYCRTDAEDVRYWWTTAVLVLLLTLDEYLSLHEQLIDPMRDLLGASGPFYYAWIVPGAIAVVIVVAVFVPFLGRLPRRLRMRILVSGGLFLSGAIGVEMVGGAIESAAGDRNSYAYIASTTVEESLEMVAVVFLIYALLDHLATSFDALSVNARLHERAED